MVNELSDVPRFDKMIKLDINYNDLRKLLKDLKSRNGRLEVRNRAIKG